MTSHQVFAMVNARGPYARAWVVALGVITLSGCASMCDSSLDHDYAAFGGVRARQDRVHGRVGSVFDPATALDLTEPYAADPNVPEVIPQGPEQIEDGPETGEVDDSGLREELLNELEQMRQQLPELPPANDTDPSIEFDFDGT